LLAAEHDIQVISGIEINTDFKDEEIHILGYFIDVKNTQLLKSLDEIKHARLERNAKIIERLNEINFDINAERVKEVAGSGTIGRPHIAQVMIEKGYASTIKEVFEKYIGRGQPAYVPRYKLLPEDAIALVERAGGTPVLAHPGLVKKESVINEIILMGIKGLEVYYPEHTSTQTNKFLNMAYHHGLLITGGSDFHGTEDTRNQLGCSGLNHLSFQHFLNKTQKSD
jgi:predicted metal-dependent phosphoesterase TrpH